MLFEHFREAGSTMEAVDGAIILTGTSLSIPEALAPRVATVSLPGPGMEEYRNLLGHLVRDLSRRGHLEVELSRDELRTLLKHLSGLTLMEAEKVLTKAMIEDGKLHAGDIRHVIEAKKAVVEKEGLLEYYPAEESLASIADLATLKAWLEKRRSVVENPVRAEEFGLSFPHGVLLLGVPGCGKSLCAKAVSMEWGLPLLRLDTSNLYNKYIGESEKNFKRAMDAAERMAPVVLWIDELEKAFASGGSEDGGVSQRILGTFLSWMQERRGDVFVVATANQIDRLPPELLRKGRFDEIFFVDLPDARTRAEIFRIHLSSRGQAPATFDLVALAVQAEGFSGAEIEQVVLSALYSAFTSKSRLDDEVLLQEIRATRPLAVTMSEKVARMRAWAEGRTVRAN
jgi:ATP-dependent 26S proteasome regulatory subunit